MHSMVLERCLVAIMVYILDSYQRPLKLDITVPSNQSLYLDFIAKEDYNSVLRSLVLVKDRSYLISTVFLVVDYNYTNNGPPILWETMIFEKGFFGKDLYCARYISHEEAINGHLEALEWAKANL